MQNLTFKQRDFLNQELLRYVLCKKISGRHCIEMIEELIQNPTLSIGDVVSKIALSDGKKQAFLTAYHQLDYQELLKVYQEAGVQWLTILDETYPDYLKHIYNPPAVLFYKGDLRLLTRKMIAIVGARKNTSYGKAALQKILPELIAAGFVTVSGLALGIDRDVHQQTLKLGGKTIGVIGTGLDLCYPKNNHALQKQMLSNELVLSEYPLGTKPLKQHFPMRNRIIAGLSLGTVVIEAAYRSGSLITANLALQEGREVFAIPGNITSPSSRGTNDLIVHGAKCVTNAEQILEEFY